MHIIPIFILCLIPIPFAFPVGELKKLGVFTLGRLVQHYQPGARHLDIPQVMYVNENSQVSNVAHDTNILPSNFKIDHLVADTVLQKELSDVSRFIIQELARLVNMMPTSSELIDRYQNHKSFPDNSEDVDSNLLLFLINLYMHHLKSSPKLLAELNTVRKNIAHYIDRAADKLYVRLHWGIHRPTSYLSFLDKLRQNVHNLMIEQEFHALFRMLLFECLIDSWNDHSVEFGGDGIDMNLILKMINDH